MIYQPKFFYNDSAGEGAGGADTETKIVDEQGAEGSENNGGDGASAPVEKIEISLEQAKAWGFDSKEQLDEHFKKLKEQNISEEEKRKAAALEDVNFRKFSIENDLLKEDDFMSHQSLSAKADRDLVFEKWVNEYKEDNPDLANDPELMNKATAEFNREYKLDSESDKVKQRGLDKLSKEAKELRAPVSQKFESAKNQFELAKTVHTEYPKFESLVESKVRQHTPDKKGAYTVNDGEEEVVVDIEITEDDRKAMAKAFATHKNFYKFKEGKEEFEKSIDQKMEVWVELNKKEVIKQKIFETALNLGRAKGSNIGAYNPFPLVDKANNRSQQADKTEEEKIRQSHNAAAQSYIR